MILKFGHSFFEGSHGRPPSEPRRRRFRILGSGRCWATGEVKPVLKQTIAKHDFPNMGHIKPYTGLKLTLMTLMFEFEPFQAVLCFVCCTCLDVKCGLP